MTSIGDFLGEGWGVVPTVLKSFPACSSSNSDRLEPREGEWVDDDKLIPERGVALATAFAVSSNSACRKIYNMVTPKSF